MRLNLELVSLFRSALIASRVEINNLFVHLVRGGNGVYNLDGLIRLFLPVRFGGSAAALRYSLRDITVTDSRAIFDDHKTASGHRLEKISLASHQKKPN